MSHEQIEIHWGERRATAELRRTHRRVLRIEVKPSGQVVALAPANEHVEAFESRVRRKSSWIFRELDRIECGGVLTPSYRLGIEPSLQAHVRVEGDRLVIFTPEVDDSVKHSRLLAKFYWLTAKNVFPERLDAMAPPFVRKGMPKPSLVIRAMTERWGSFTASGRILLNVDLARASPALIDYVICHELADGFFPDHGRGWRDLLATAMPDWEARKERLETSRR